jgi:hypothetical protein
VIQDEAKKCQFCGVGLHKSWSLRQLGVGSAFVLLVLMGLGYRTLFETSAGSVRSSETGIEMPSPNAGTFNINSDYPSVSVSTVADAERASRDLIKQAGHSCDAVRSLSPIGRVESGGTVHRANCSNGEQYVVVLSDHNRLSFLSSCAAFIGSTGEQC